MIPKSVTYYLNGPFSVFVLNGVALSGAEINILSMIFQPQLSSTCWKTGVPATAPCLTTPWRTCTKARRIHLMGNF